MTNAAASLTYVVVIPATRPPLVTRVLASLTAQGVPALQVVVVDDSADASVGAALAQSEVNVVRGSRRGPAAARNTGWREATKAGRVDWVVFLDDDVIPSPRWATELVADLADAAGDVAGITARLSVPLTTSRPNDWERQTQALETASWITADMAYRVEVLLATGGFDERFPRAFREDSDLALRVLAAGWRVTQGRRETAHPVRPAPWHVSLSRQAGNADNALMRRLHGRDWRSLSDNPPSPLPAYGLTIAALAVGAAGAATAAASPDRRRLAGTVAALGLAWWLQRTAGFAWRRIAPGPRTATDIAAMAVTSALIPPLALWHRLRGELRHRHVQPALPPVRAVLFDKDGTLVHDVPYNGDPELVQPVADARRSVQRLREAGLRLGLVSNQSGIARGLLDRSQVEAVLARTAELVGPFDTVHICPHDDSAGCACRKPKPGMVLDAARALGVPPQQCVVVGDIGADVGAALAAGARAVLVPTAATRREERQSAPHRADTLTEAVDLILGGRV
ncbi:MAG: HAD-IIIA family hydrolase [Actinomycetales bacterium]